MLSILLSCLALTASVPEAGSVSLNALDILPGAEFGAAVIDLNSGTVLGSTGEGIFSLNDPDIILLAYAVELMQSGAMPPDSVVGRNITIRDEFWWAFRGDRESAARVMWTIGLESASAWAEERGFLDTELHDVQLEWEGAPETAPSLSSLDDVIEAMFIIYEGFDIPAVGEIMEAPEMGEAQASTVAEGWDLYGWVDSGSEHKTFLLVARHPDGTDIGLVLLSRDLCCEQKADLALMLMWEAVEEAYGL